MGSRRPGFRRQAPSFRLKGEFQRDYANCRDQDDKILVGASSPVGLYEQGKTPDHGLYDMTGNIWEWTSSLWCEAPPYDTQVLEHLDDGASPRVVRGGSWSYVHRDARAAVRNLGRPGGRSSNVGGRVCVLPPLDT